MMMNQDVQLEHSFSQPKMMNKGHLKDQVRSHLKKCSERFCMTTEMHGWLEMYTAKTFIWRVIWALLVCMSIGFTIFHVRTAVKQFMDQATITIFQRAKSDDVLYPPLRLCYNFWFRWGNWNKAMSYNYSKETILYGFSFINNIFTESEFDVDEVVANFSRLLKEYNFSTITNYFKSVMKPASSHIVNNDEFTAMFQEVKILYIRNVYYFCLYVSSEQMGDYFKRQESKGNNNKWLQFDTIDETYDNFKDVLTGQEYNAYMKYWINSRTVYKYNDSSNHLLLDFAPTIFLFPNSYSDLSVDIVSDNYYYFVDMSASASTWKNTKENVCYDGQYSIAYNTTCDMNCLGLASQKSTTCRMLNTAGVMNEDYPERTCHRLITTITNGAVIQNATIKLSNELMSSTEGDGMFYNDCRRKCINACQLWTYTISASSKQIFKAVRDYSYKKTTSVTISYPETTSIILMVETDAQTWDSFLGNVGGLLGIWTGASLLSFIQMFYLCCCADLDGWSNNFHFFDNFRAKLCTRMNKKFRPNDVTIIENFKTPRKSI